jgi:radical SAM protein with 4Fe4S-binding SPASM domain
VSLDGPDAVTHDGFRRVRGSFAQTQRIIEAVCELGVPLQINSTVSRRTLPTLEGLARHAEQWPLTLWAVFFLIQTGRGAGLEQITAGECERVLRWLHDLSSRVPFGIKTTEAPHYRRVAWDAGRGATDAAARPPAAAPALVRARRAVNDGNGFVFIDHVGEICPSGFLPVGCGNVRDAQLVDVYRHHPVFTRLRDASALQGRCGRCRYRTICGGSRSRAFHTSGDMLESDPLCAYDPGPEVEPPVAAG